jgi:hypothetical protein
MKYVCSLTACAALFAICCHAGATGTWAPVPPAALDKLRGGFVTATGLQISLGVERLVMINGAPVSLVSLQGIGAGTAGRQGIAAGAEGTARLIQQGGNNVFGAALDQPGATFIQNSLNGQTIRTETHISANVNSAALVRDLNFRDSMREAALSSGGSR